MKTLKKGSFWLGLVEKAVYIFPTLGTVLYYYFSSIQETASKSSQYSFILALVLLVLFLIYKAVIKRSIGELRQGTVQQETDMRSETNGVRFEMLAENSRADRVKLDLYDRGAILLTLIIVALAVRILEMSLIGLTNLAYIACGSVLVGSGIHIGVISLEKKEKLKGFSVWEKGRNKKQ